MMTYLPNKTRMRCDLCDNLVEFSGVMPSGWTRRVLKDGRQPKAYRPGLDLCPDCRDKDDPIAQGIESGLSDAEWGALVKRVVRVRGKWISRLPDRINLEYMEGFRGGGFNSRLGRGYKTHGADCIEYNFLEVPPKA